MPDLRCLPFNKFNELCHKTGKEAGGHSVSAQISWVTAACLQSWKAERYCPQNSGTQWDWPINTQSKDKNTSLMWISFTTHLNILTRGATLCGLLPSPHSLENPQTLPQVHLNQLSNLAKVDEASPPRDVPWNGACKKWKDHEKNRKSYERKLHQPEPFASVLAIYKKAGLMCPSLPCKSDRASLRLITCLQSLQVTDDPQTQASSCDGNLTEAPEVWAWHTNPSQPDMARHEKSNLWMQFVWGLALAGPDP